jgi:hypothetical protein
MTQERGPSRPLSDAFESADEIDWWHLLRCIPDSGHGRFWKTVFREIRSDLGLPPPEELFD